jgi:phosphonate transport system substrate-binding protein
MRRSITITAALLLLLAFPCPGQQQAEPGAEEEPLLFGVVSFYYPRLMFLKYGPLVEYLSEQTGRRWELRLGTTYEQTAGELCAGRLTAAYLGPLTYIRAHEACGAEPVARLNTGGEESYRSYILVREGSPIRDLADLKGRRFAFGSPLSTSSHLVPRDILIRAGLEPGKDVQCAFLEHHEEAARAVQMGEVDACGVRDIVGDRFLQKGLRLLVKSDPIPNFPVVIAPGTAPDVSRQLARVLVDLPRQDPEIAQAMASWDRELADGFARTTDAEYDTIRDLAREVLGAGGLTLPEEALRCAGSGPRDAKIRP